MKKAVTRRRTQKKPARKKLLMKNRLPQAKLPEVLHLMSLKPVRLKKLLSVCLKKIYSLKSRYTKLVM
jgi:hypothetical protein